MAMTLKDNRDAGVTPSLRHLAIIMDGNRRWARSRGLSTLEGHEAGSENLRSLCRLCVDRGIPYLSVYAFSTENWKRAAAEVSALMTLIIRFFRKYHQELLQEGVKVVFSGELEGLPEKSRRVCQDLEKEAPGHERLRLVICLNYGGRDEILRAFRRAEKEGRLPSQLNEAEIPFFFDCPDLPAPDLLIRPGGEKRLSNFWLWQSAYTEFYFCDTLWPDFGASDLDAAVDSFFGRERRFGGNGEEGNHA